MVNYTPQWYRRSGRLDARQIADGYCDLMLEAYAANSLTGSESA
jgi:Tetracyclin repressor-like, C-terminal domain